MKIELISDTSNSANTAETPVENSRHATPAQLVVAFSAGRECLLKLFAAYRDALGTDMQVNLSPELNLPLWEMGHIAWFEEYWIARNPLRAQGISADHAVMENLRTASCLPNADARYDSSNVAHATRWQLVLPSANETLAYLAEVRESTLALLNEIVITPERNHDDALYFFRLALFHEAMHREAWIYMAQTLGIALHEAFSRAPERPHNLPTDDCVVDAGRWRLGSTNTGFVFDNELCAHEVDVAAFEIDRAAVTWQRYLPFIEAGGYTNRAWWSDAGWEWRQQQSMPRYLRRVGEQWQRYNFGQWQNLDLHLPAMNLTRHEAQAWCLWAGRRLPSEAEWEMAACTRTASEFFWGEVWEWTSSAFAPYAGFMPHPYRDYSMPWFDGRPVLRGASLATGLAMRHPRYRNFFPAERNDIFSGFRSCAI